LTHFIQLDYTIRLEHQAVVNLSADIRNFTLKNNETFQEVANKLEWASNLRASAALIRQLEVAFARLESRLDEMFTVLQFVVNGKIPFNLVLPSLLLYILVNVSLSLPEG
jgi:hypothetical protein